MGPSERFYWNIPMIPHLNNIWYYKCYMQNKVYFWYNGIWLCEIVVSDFQVKPTSLLFHPKIDFLIFTSGKVVSIQFIIIEAVSKFGCAVSFLSVKIKFTPPSHKTFQQTKSYFECIKTWIQCLWQFLFGTEALIFHKSCQMVIIYRLVFTSA